MFCPYCGKENRDHTAFCTGCGRKMESPDSLERCGDMFSDESVADSFIRKQSRGKNGKSRLSDPITGEESICLPTNSPDRKKRRFRVLLVIMALVLAALLVSGIIAGKYVYKERQWQGYYDLGSQYLSETDYEEAVVAFTNAIEIDDRKAEAYVGRGDAYSGSAGNAAAEENYGEAEDLYEKALEDYETAAGLGDTEAENKIEETESNIAEIGSSSAEFEIVRDDRSVYDESGKLLANWYYEKVVLEEKNEAFKKINTLIQQECDRFFEETPDYENDVYASPPQSDMEYSNISEAEVTCNENGILSIRMTQTWFMGGVMNINYYGFSFDLHTGETVELQDIFSMDEEQISSYLKEETIDYIDENPDKGWWDSSLDDAKQTINEYDLEEFEFYIEDSNVCLCYLTYELGPGAMGPVIVRCPIPQADSSGTSAVQTKTVSSSAVSGERDVVLVLDISSSMAGEPIDETKKAAVNFVETILQEDACIGIVTYNSSAEIASDFSSDRTHLSETVNEIQDSGSTNIEAGLNTAYSMLQESHAEKQIIVLMSDGEPNDGKTGDELIARADEMKDKGVYIYTLGFFEELSDKSSAQALMEGIASDGCHYEVEDAESLIFFFGDIADQINGQKYIYIRIACPVDVTVSFNGETLSSDDTVLNTRTSFGTLTFEEGNGNSVDDRIKILRLKDGTDYDIRIVGTGLGTMNYTIGFMDENGAYSDQRYFRNIAVSGDSIIDTVASDSERTVLNIDEDGDDRYDLIYEAGTNETASQVDYGYMVYIAGAVLGAVIVLMTLLKVLIIIRKRRKRKYENE